MTVISEVKVPHETVNDEYVTISTLYFKNGDMVNAGDIILDIETSKAVISVEPEGSGYIEYFVEEGEEAAVGSVIAKIHQEKPQLEQKEKPKAETNVDTVFSHAAKELIERKNLDAADFTGRDFVSVDDVKRKLSPQPVKPTAMPDNVEIKKVSKAKQVEIENLSYVQPGNIVSTINMYIDIDKISFKSPAKLLKNPLLSLIIVEIAKLLKKYPEFNCFYAGENIAYYKDINIGLAVDLGKGLKVLKLNNTDTKAVKDLEVEVFYLTKKYLQDKLEISDMTGTTFTITDLSAEGAHSFTPLINKQQSAILGISAIDEKLQRFTLSLSFDHRVTEGRSATIFLKELKENMEKA